MTEKEFYSELSQKLSNLVDKTGLKRKELAEKMEVNNSFIGGILNDRERASAYRINQILENTGKPTLIEWLELLVDEKKTAKLTLKSQDSPLTLLPA